jgi:hypothetical protein
VLGVAGVRFRRNKAVYEIQKGSGGAYLPEQSLTDNPYEVQSVSSSGDLLGIGDFSETLELGPGQYFVEGDNRESFNGSSLWGPVGIDRISGRVILVYWPIKHLRIL